MRTVVKLTLASLTLLFAVSTVSAQTLAPGAKDPKKDFATQAQAEPEKSAFDQWAHDVKNPTPWFSWGGDLQLRTYYANNYKTLSENVPNHEEHFQRYRARLWTTFKPMTDLDINARFLYQFFTFEQPPAGLGTSDHLSEMFIDNLNVKFKNFLDQPATLTVGRQDIFLGDGWLVCDGTPAEGSRTAFFDAVRYTYTAKEFDTTADLIYLNDGARNSRLWEPDDEPRNRLIEQDEQGAIAYFTNKSIENVEISPYFMYKHAEQVFSNGYSGDLYTPGIRVAQKLDDNWRYRVEGAYQFGTKKDGSLLDNAYNNVNAFGFNSQVNYFTNDKLNNNYRLSYEFLSGDNPDTAQNEAFDVLWGRWARWTDLYADTLRLDTALPGAAGRPGDFTNYHRFGPGWSFNPNKQIEICTDYYLLFADQNTFKSTDKFSNDGPFRGQILSSVLRYKFNQYVSGHLVGEIFLPGNYYSEQRRDIATFLRYELVFTF